VLREYIPLVILILVVTGYALMMIMMSHMIPRRRPTPIKESPYESGVPPVGGTRSRFNVKFYLVAVLFIIFDIETVFLIPWAVGFRRMGLVGLIEAALFVLVLSVGLLYVWKRGALDWD